jgi:alcohol dehydrogenase class IV
LLIRRIKHSFLMRLAEFLLKFAPGVSYMAFAGEGSSRNLCRHIAMSGLKKPLVVTDKPLCELGVVAQALQGLEEEGVEHVIFDGVLPDPTYSIVFEGKALYQREGCDGLIAIGGGSSIDAAKIIGLALSVPEHPREYVGFGLVKEPIPPLYAMPTTAGTGSEATMGAVISDDDTHDKGVISGSPLSALAVALDPLLMTGLPPHITAATGMDALTHAVEAYISIWDRGDAYDKAAAATRLIFEHLPEACRDGSNVKTREAMAQAAYMAGQAINQVNVGNVHAIAHQLGARFGVPHGQANAMVMPHVLELSKGKAGDRLAALGREVGCESADAFIEAIRQLNRSLGLPSKVKGLTEDDYKPIIDKALEEADGYSVPYMMSRNDVKQVLKQLH